MSLRSILGWLVRGTDDLGKLSDAWLADTERLTGYVAWNEREASGCLETHAYRDDFPAAQHFAREAMKAERHASYLARTHGTP